MVSEQFFYMPFYSRHFFAERTCYKVVPRIALSAENNMFERGIPLSAENSVKYAENGIPYGRIKSKKNTSITPTPTSHSSKQTHHCLALLCGFVNAPRIPLNGSVYVVMMADKMEAPDEQALIQKVVQRLCCDGDLSNLCSFGDLDVRLKSGLPVNGTVVLHCIPCNLVPFPRCSTKAECLSYERAFVPDVHVGENDVIHARGKHPEYDPPSLCCRGVSLYLPIDEDGPAWNFAHAAMSKRGFHCMNGTVKMNGVQLFADRVLNKWNPHSIHITATNLNPMPFVDLDRLATCQEGEWIQCIMEAGVEAIDLPRWPDDEMLEDVLAILLWVTKNANHADKCFRAALYSYLICDSLEYLEPDPSRLFCEDFLDVLRVIVDGWEEWYSSGVGTEFADRMVFMEVKALEIIEKYDA